MYGIHSGLYTRATYLKGLKSSNILVIGNMFLNQERQTYVFTSDLRLIYHSFNFNIILL
jgi:hypothetical protein